jgi:hypothetical protein
MSLSASGMAGAQGYPKYQPSIKKTMSAAHMITPRGSSQKIGCIVFSLVVAANWSFK